MKLKLFMNSKGVIQESPLCVSETEAPACVRPARFQGLLVTLSINTGAYIITNTVLRVPYYNSIYPKTLF